MGKTDKESAAIHKNVAIKKTPEQNEIEARIVAEMKAKSAAHEKMTQSLICELFNVKFAEQVSKRALMDAVGRFFMQSDYAASELYCIAPEHSYFAKSKPEDLERLKAYKERRDAKALLADAEPSTLEHGSIEHHVANTAVNSTICPNCAVPLTPDCFCEKCGMSFSNYVGQ